MQAVEHGQVTFTGYAKRMGNALGQKAINQKMAGKLCSHVPIVLDMTPTLPLGGRCGPNWNEESPASRATLRLFRCCRVAIAAAGSQGLAGELFVAQWRGCFKRGEFVEELLSRLLMLQQHFLEFLPAGFRVHRG